MIKMINIPVVLRKITFTAILVGGFMSAHSFAVSCSGIPDWKSGDVYTQNMQAKQSNKAYKAKWWTQGESPAAKSGQWDVWLPLGNCDGSTASSSKPPVSSSKPSSSISSSKAASSKPASSKSSSSKSSASSSSTGSDCGSAWYKANLTHYESYPDPGSEECIKFNGCTWAGQFYGLNEKMPESWVMANNIAAIHLKDWNWLGLKTLNLRQGTKRITVKVYDGCSDSDCDGCCTQNLAGDGYLIDLEKYTKNRFGSGSGIVEFQVCN
jgi:hypothetical protein